VKEKIKLKDKIKRKVNEFVLKFLDDILLIIGAGFISYGISKIYYPLGFITIGIACLGYAFLFAKKMAIMTGRR